MAPKHNQVTWLHGVLDQLIPRHRGARIADAAHTCDSYAKRVSPDAEQTQAASRES